MIDFADLDMMARGGALALLALWSWLLLRDHRDVLPARIAVMMTVSIGAHVLATIPGPMDYGFVVNWLLLVGSALVPGAFWLFARTWFDDETRIDLPSWIIVLLPPILFATAHSLFARGTPIFLAAGLTMRIVSFGVAIAGLWAAWRGRADDLIEARRRLRAQLIWSVGLFVIFTNTVEILINTNRAPETLRTVIEIGILLLTGALCGAMFGLRQAELFATATAKPTPDPRRDEPWMTGLAERLRAHMEREKPHRDDALTIAALAAQLGEQEYRLRRLINGELGYRNFAAFLNGYRLAEVKSALRDPSQKDVPILTIALDAGFGSLGPFNRAFREAEGMTPSGYRGATGASP
jgi:AraC-like DNA-binding protein